MASQIHDCFSMTFSNSSRHPSMNFNMKQLYAYHGTSCKITAKPDKICGNDSKTGMASQIPGFFKDFLKFFMFGPVLRHASM